MERTAVNTTGFPHDLVEETLVRVEPADAALPDGVTSGGLRLVDDLAGHRLVVLTHRFLDALAEDCDAAAGIAGGEVGDVPERGLVDDARLEAGFHAAVENRGHLVDSVAIEADTARHPEPGPELVVELGEQAVFLEANHHERQLGNFPECLQRPVLFEDVNLVDDGDELAFDVLDAMEECGRRRSSLPEVVGDAGVPRQFVERVGVRGVRHRVDVADGCVERLLLEQIDDVPRERGFPVPLGPKMKTSEPEMPSVRGRSADVRTLISPSRW